MKQWRVIQTHLHHPRVEGVPVAMQSEEEAHSRQEWLDNLHGGQRVVTVERIECREVMPWETVWENDNQEDK